MSYDPNNIGDILITFQPSDKALLTRSKSPWLEVLSFDDTRMLITKSDTNWCGFPLITYQDEAWQIWALGEFYEDTNPDLSWALETSSDLNGHFLIIAYELKTKHWHIITDRFGTVHAYHANDGNKVALGTFSPAVAVAASAKKMDWAAVEGLLTYGFFLGDQTYWDDLQIIPPAAHLVLDQHGHRISEEKTWIWAYNPERKLTYEDALGRFAEILKVVVHDQVRDKIVALPLSGGLDSRSTLVPLTNHNNLAVGRLVPFSYGYTKDSVEIKIARQIGEERGLVVQTWVIQPYLFHQIDRILSTSEGFFDLLGSRQSFVVDDLTQQASHVLAAHWGDVWLDDMGFLGLTESFSDENLAAKLVQKFTKKGSPQLLNLFRDVLPQNHVEINTAKILKQLHPLEQIWDVDFKVKAWKTQNWSFRWTLASLRAYQAGLYPLLPFYDHRLVDFFTQLPSSWVKGRTFQIDYLKAFAPDLARVKWQPYDANLYNYQFFHSWLLPKRVLKKLSRIFSSRQIIERNWELQLLNPQGRLGLETWLLTPGLKLHNYVSRQRVFNFLNQFFDHPAPGKGYAVSMLLTFSAWLEAYG